MIAAGQEHSSLACAKDIDLCAAEWLERSHREEWSRGDQDELDAWFAVSVAHRLAYLRVEAAWGRAHRLSALRRPQRDGGLLVAAGRLSRLAMIVAAIAALSAVGAGIVFLTKKAPEQIYATAVGGHRTIMLDDGSKVELNTNSILRVETSAAQRTMWLDKGEAYFQVRHNTARPFIVVAGGHRVTDLGTKFLVRTDPQHLEVSLVEGRIRFDAPDGRMREPLLLSPGDSVTAQENTITVTRSSPRELAKELSWRRGVLIFDNTTLGDAAAEFNRYNRQKIVIAGTSVERLRIDGTFPAENLDVFVRAAQQLFELRVEYRGGDKVISR